MSDNPGSGNRLVRKPLGKKIENSHMAPVRIAMNGAGLIGRRHTDLDSASVERDLAAICDLNSAVGSVAQQYDVPYFQDYTDLLEQVPLDGAIIATPNAEHVPIGIACAQRAIDVLVEKPIADTVAEGKKLIDAAPGNVQLMVGHYRRFLFTRSSKRPAP